jgi:uncharacterized protein YndB with AHSA1/START domain
MASVSVNRTIAAPPERIYAMVSDLPRMGEWSPENTGGAWVGGATGPAVGAKFDGHNAIGPHKWTTIATITRVEPGRVFEFRVTVGPVKVATWRYEFAATPEGCTVTETWTDQRNGVAKFLSKLSTKVTDRAEHNRANMETTLANLATAAEQ